MGEDKSFSKNYLLEPPHLDIWRGIILDTEPAMNRDPME